MAAGSQQPEDYHVVRNCGEEWLVYNSEYKNYVPFIPEVHESEPSVSILINLVQDRHFRFFLKVRREAYLFINGSLQKSLQSGEWVSLSCDSLQKKYGRTEVMLTVYGLRGMEGLSSFMAFPKNSIVSDSIQAISRSLVSLKPKSANVFRDFSVIASILILLISAVVFLSVPSIANKMVSPAAFFSRDFRSELYNHYRAYSPVMVFATLVLALITAFLLLLAERYIAPVLPSALGISDTESIWSLLVDYLKVTLLCLGLCYLKFFVISLTLGVLNMTEVAHIHFIKAVQSSLLFYGVISLGLLAMVFQLPGVLNELGDLLLWCITLYYAIRYILLYIILNQTGRIINLYLISYLCVVELIPLIIGVKFIT